MHTQTNFVRRLHGLEHLCKGPRCLRSAEHLPGLRKGADVCRDCRHQDAHIRHDPAHQSAWLRGLSRAASHQHLTRFGGFSFSLKEFYMAYGDIRKTLGLSPGTNLKEHRTYRIWYSMHKRCSYKKHHAWERYGGAGIKVAPRWNSFLAFLEDMGHPPSSSHSIERIRNEDGYSKSNCKWATPQEQTANRRSTILAPSGLPLKTHCEANGLPYATIWHRMHRRGMSFIEATNKPIRSYQNA
jgi:hypothetical protein